MLSFIVLMTCEEFAIFKTKRELESFISDATIAATDEAFNRDEYFLEVEPAIDNAPENDSHLVSFQPVNFSQPS